MKDYYPLSFACGNLIDMSGIIYKIVNKINNKVYIGQTIRTLEERWKSHFYETVNQKLNTKLGKAIRKYGFESFSIEIIESTEELDSRERYWIDFYQSFGKNGYNIKIGGIGGPHAVETKRKIAKANTRRIWTEEMRKNMSDSIKIWHKKRGFVPRTEKFKKRISEANKGRTMPQKTKIIFQQHNKQISKPIICIENKKEYPSISAACKEMNLNDGHLRMHLKGKHSHIKGFHFKFK